MFFIAKKKDRADMTRSLIFKQPNYAALLVLCSFWVLPYLTAA